MSKYVTKKQLVDLRKISAYDYLRQYDPDMLVRISKDTYCTKEHDSLHISPRGWSWWSQGVKGYSAIDYFVEVENLTFPDACHVIMDAIKMDPIAITTQRTTKRKEFELPEKDDNNFEVFRYLCKQRKIEKEVVTFFISKNMLYQDKKFKNIVFVGYNNQTPAYAFKRGTKGNFKQDHSGSDKAYSFRFENRNSSTVHLFEAAIDMLSYMSLVKLNGSDFTKDNCLSLAGATNTEEIPLALKAFLERNKNVNTIVFHLDNDIVGMETTEKLMSTLSDSYTCINRPPLHGKDVNEELQIHVRKMETHNLER